MKPGLSLRVSQQLALTPQLQQSIRLLQLSTLELSAEVERMLDENPFLEREEDEGPGAADHAARPRADEGAPATDDADAAVDGEAGFDADAPAPADWDGEDGSALSSDDGAWGDAATARGAPFDGEDERDPAQRTPSHETLAEHLHRQALGLRLGPEDAAALRFLIESLDEHGYLAESLDELVATLADAGDAPEQLEQLRHRFALALALLQSMEPAGVGARRLTECLVLQLRRRQHEHGLAAEERALLALALRICALPEALELLARRDARRLAALTGAGEDAVRAAMQTIGRLEPKPGRQFADLQQQIVVPDVIVSAAGRGAGLRFRVQLNPEAMPRLRVHELYASALRGGRGEQHQALAQRVQEARWFIRNIQQRFDTILRVAGAIVERQRGFFVHGELAMRPLVQRELADELGVHESTISRVTSAKYMATPRGTFELKYFFGSALATEAGGNASSTAVRALIKQFIGAENPARPLSDSQLAELLKAQGIDCARRTVAKYREGLRIPVASLRKAVAE